MNYYKSHFLKSLLLLILFCTPCLKGYSQNWQWARGSTGGDFESSPMATDASGNVFVAGIGEAAPLNFGSVNVPFLTSYIENVIIKYDNAGNVLWAKGIDIGSSIPISLATDAAGNCIMLGFTESPLIQAGALSIVLSAGYTYQYFLVKYDPAGNVLWAKTSAEEPSYFITFTQPTYIQPLFMYPGAVATDAAGNIFITGSFNGISTTIGSFTLTNTDATGTTDDIFAAKYDPSGNPVWAKSIGGSKSEDAFGITVTPAGNIYITGIFSSPVMNVGSSVITNFYGVQDAILAEFDAIGNPIWATAAGGKYTAYGIALASDAANNVYLTGSFGDTSITFAGNTFTRAYPSAVHTMAQYLVAFSPSNTVTWGKTFSTPSAQIIGYDITLTPCGGVWVSGAWEFLNVAPYTYDSVNLDGHTLYLPDSSEDPMFIAGFSVSGAYLDAAAVRSAGDDWVNIASDPAGNLFICADYSTGWGTNDFRIGDYTLPPTQNELLLLAKYTPLVVATDTTFKTSDTTICANTSILLQAPTTGYTPPYLWNNGVIGTSIPVNSSGTYWVLSTSGCSASVLSDTFHVTLNNIDLSFSFGSDTFACNPVTLQIPEQGVSYLWQNGNTTQDYTATESGTYIATVSKTNCSYSDTINVTITEIKTKSLDTMVCIDHPFQVNFSIAVPTNGTVEWSNNVISPNISLSDTGTYYAFVTNNACKATDTLHIGGQFCDCWCVFPTAFTPNNDHENDGFRAIVQPTCMVHGYKLSIFDRWGSVVFTTNDPNEYWYGTYGSTPAELGVYMYEASFTAGIPSRIFSYKGDVTLIR